MEISPFLFQAISLLTSYTEHCETVMLNVNVCGVFWCVCVSDENRIEKYIKQINS